jgi:hypothetical protein
MAPLVQGIGILSSVRFRGRVQRAFQAGANLPPGFYYHIRDNGSFNPGQLAHDVDQLVNDAQVGLIVTCGGSSLAKQHRPISRRMTHTNLSFP